MVLSDRGRETERPLRLMSIKLAHIGLGKCGSVFLNNIFKEIEKETNIKLINLFDFVDTKKTHALQKLSNLEKVLPNNFIISHRTLFSHGWEFNQIYKSFELNKKNFSKHVTILIIIRNPYELLNSIYCQSIHVMNIIKPQDFFYVEDNDIVRKEGRFNLFNFNYEKLIFLYKSYFENVIVIKHEELDDLNFLKRIFNINDEVLKNLQNLQKKTYNRSISRYGINFILFLNKFLDLNKYQRLVRNNIKQPNSILSKIRNKFLYQLLLREFFQNKFDKIFPYKKYYIDKKTIPINLEKLINDYDKL